MDFGLPSILFVYFGTSMPSVQSLVLLLGTYGSAQKDDLPVIGHVTK